MNTLITLVSFTLGVLLLLSVVVTTPAVYISNSTGECVKVDHIDYSCSNLPERYEAVYVK